MSQYRKNDILEQFRRPQTNKASKSRDLKGRLLCMRSKQTFLTDTQTSDYTKSSGQMNSYNIQHLELTIQRLQKQNADLKQKIIELKTNQFFEINEQKLKNILRQTQKLKQQLTKYKKQLQQSLIQRDFLQRFNKNLKIQCQVLTKQLIVLKNSNNPPQPKKIQKIASQYRQTLSSGKSRNSSIDNTIGKKKETSTMKKQDNNQNVYTIKQAKSVSRLHDQYYINTKGKIKGSKNS